MDNQNDLKPIELSPPQASFLSFSSNRNLLHCGQGFGKTHVEGIIPALLIQRAPEAMGFIGANTYGQLSDSTLFRIFEVWKEYFGWTEYNSGNPSGVYVFDKMPPKHFKQHGYTFKSNQNKIFFVNGAVVMTASLDNYMALDGREFAWAILDETKDTKEEALKEVILGRLRGKGLYTLKDFDITKDLIPFCSSNDPRADKAANPLWIATSPSKAPWLGEMFNFDELRDQIDRDVFQTDDYFCHRGEHNSSIIASAYWNKHNLPDDYIEAKERELSQDRVDMLVYGSPFGKMGVEYYSKWNRKLHISKDAEFMEGQPLHITFDFNVNPYMTLVVSQLIPGDRWTMNIIDEFCLISPNNSIEAVCRAFDSEYGHLCKAGLYYYGDASGNNTLPIEQLRNYYIVIKNQLDHLLSNDSKRLLNRNIHHRSVGEGTLGRRDFMNSFLSGKYPIDFKVNSRCKKVIQDFENCKEDANGAKLKKKEKINGVMAERYGHTSDAIDSMVCWLYY